MPATALQVGLSTHRTARVRCSCWAVLLSLVSLEPHLLAAAPGHGQRRSVRIVCQTLKCLMCRVLLSQSHEAGTVIIPLGREETEA